MKKKAARAGGDREAESMHTPPAGMRVVALLQGVRDAALLERPEAARGTLRAAVESFGLRVAIVGEPGQQSQLEPSCATHASIHTHPGTASALVDVGCCSPAFDPDAFAERLRAAFCAQSCNYTTHAL